jgi:hypothetical protein
VISLEEIKLLKLLLEGIKMNQIDSEVGLYNFKTEIAANKLAAYAVKNNTKALSLAKIFKLLDKKIKNWPVFRDDIVFAEEKLVYAGGELSDFSKEILDYEEFINFFSNIRGQKNDQQKYVEMRSFIINNPLLSEKEYIEHLLTAEYEEKAELIKEIYEPLPISSKNKGLIEKCPVCGWIINKNFEGQKYCVRKECAEKSNYFRQSIELKDKNHYRLKRDLMNFISIPGQSELRLYNEYNKIQNLKIELWPYLDLYDFEIKINNEKWAVDVKDWINPYALASNLEVISAENYDRLFYLIPKHRSKTVYMDILKNHHEIDQQNIQIISEKNFGKFLRKQLKKGNNHEETK